MFISSATPLLVSVACFASYAFIQRDKQEEQKGSNTSGFENVTNQSIDIYSFHFSTHVRNIVSIIGCSVGIDNIPSTLHLSTDEKSVIHGSSVGSCLRRRLGFSRENRKLSRLVGGLSLHLFVDVSHAMTLAMS